LENNRVYNFGRKKKTGKRRVEGDVKPSNGIDGKKRSVRKKPGKGPGRISKDFREPNRPMLGEKSRGGSQGAL